MVLNEDRDIVDYSSFFNCDKKLICLTFKNDNKYSMQHFHDILFDEHQIDINNIARCNQIHSDNVLYIDKPGIYNDVDGLITNIKYNIILQIQTADCVPIFLYDKKNKNIGLIHSGWKGTHKRIVLKALEILKYNDSELKNIMVVLGPFIKSCCFEVRHDVAQYFNSQFVINNKNKTYIDLGSKIKYDLISNGILKKNIYISNICSKDDLSCNSYRRDGNDSGRMYSLIFNKK